MPHGRDVSFGPLGKGGCKGNVVRVVATAMSSWFGICC